MIQSRPPMDRRFSREDTQEDFEAFQNQFVQTTDLEGVTDKMRFGEMKFWTKGTALLIVSSYDRVKDPTEALQSAMAHLRREYARKIFTAKQMLEDLLSGPKINREDSNAIRVFIVKLQNAYLKAIM